MAVKQHVQSSPRRLLHTLAPPPILPCDYGCLHPSLPTSQQYLWPQYAGKPSIQNPSVHWGTQFESSTIIGRTSHGCDPPWPSASIPTTFRWPLSCSYIFSPLVSSHLQPTCHQNCASAPTSHNFFLAFLCVLSSFPEWDWSKISGLSLLMCLCLRHLLLFVAASGSAEFFNFNFCILSRFRVSFLVQHTLSWGFGSLTECAFHAMTATPSTVSLCLTVPQQWHGMNHLICHLCPLPMLITMGILQLLQPTWLVNDTGIETRAGIG